MNTAAIVAIAVGVVVAILLTLRPSGPKVTTIETRRDSTDAKGE